MAYPYEIRNRAGEDTIFFKKIAEGASAIGNLHTTPVRYTVNLPPNTYSIAFVLETLGNDRQLNLRVHPWLDEEQTKVGDAMGLSAIGSGANSSTSAVAVAAVTATGTGQDSGQVGSTVGGMCVSPTVPFGLRVSVQSATALTRGQYDVTVLAIPKK